MKMELWGSITTDERLYRLPRYMAGMCSFIFLRHLYDKRLVKGLLFFMHRFTLCVGLHKEIDKI